MKLKLNYGAMNGMVQVGGLNLQSTVEIAGGEAYLRQADELYQAGQEQDARDAVRKALKVAMQRLDAVHGTGAQQDGCDDCLTAADAMETA
jgi:hypothetical protein